MGDESDIYSATAHAQKGELAAIIVATGSRFRMTLPPRYLRTNPAVWIHLLSHADKGKKEWRSERNGPKEGAERRRPASHTPWRRDLGVAISCSSACTARCSLNGLGGWAAWSPPNLFSSPEGQGGACEPEPCGVLA